MKDILIKIHSDGKDGELSWMRVACSFILLTGIYAILVQLAMCDTVADLGSIEWMQPVALIGTALMGKVGQKQIEKV